MLDNENRPHVKSGPIKYTKGFATKRFFSKVINLIIILLILIIVIGSIFVYVKQPVKTDDGYVLAEPIYEFIEHGEKVMVVEGDGFNLFTPLKRFLLGHEAFTARVVAGPYGEIEQSKEKFRVSDGENIISVNLENPGDYLDLEYIVRKLDESGEPLSGELDLIITKEDVLGKVN